MAFAYKRTITIDHTKIDSDLTNYPVMVKLTTSNFDFTEVRSDGKDIAFYNKDNNLLDFEEEYFNKNKFKYLFNFEQSLDSTGLAESIGTASTYTYGVSNNKYGANGLYLSGDGTFTAPVEIDLSQDYTIDWWSQYGTSNGGLIVFRLTGGDEYFSLFSIHQSGANVYTEYRVNDVTLRSLHSTPSSGTRKHYALVRYNNVTKLYIDGIYNKTITNLVNTTKKYLFLSARLGTINIDGIRILEGTALWTQDFTVPSSIGYSEAVYHIRIPSVSSTVDTTFTMKYGDSTQSTDLSNATNVWDSNFVMVQHMGSSLLDSTSNNNDMTNYGSEVVSGLNGNARNFNGSSDKISFPKLLTSPTEISVMIISKCDTTSTEQRVFSHNNLEPYVSVRLNQGGVANRLQVDLTHSGGETALVYSSGDLMQYNLISTTGKENSYHKLFFNGVSISSSSISEFDYTATTGNYLGANRGGTVNFFDGIIDEIRVSNIARNDAWILADDYNLRLNTLISISDQSDIGIGFNAVNIGGVWKSTVETKVNIGGVWKKATAVFTNINGIWKEDVN